MTEEAENPELIVRPVRALRHHEDKELYLNVNDTIGFLNTVATSHQGNAELAELVGEDGPEATYKAVMNRGAAQVAFQLIELLQQTVSFHEQAGTID